MGTRLTVFPRAAWATFRGLGRDADVVLEVCNGIAFFTSLWRWMRKPRVLLVFHVHQEHYVTELGLRGRVAAFLLEQRAAADPLSRRPGDHDLAVLARGPRRPWSRARAHPRRLLRPGLRPARARARGGRADAHLPGAPEAVQAHRAPVRRARGDPRGAPRPRRRRRPPRRARSRGGAPRAGQPRDLPRPRRRGGEGAAAGAGVGRADRLVGRGLVPDRVRGRRLRHADGGDARRRPGRGDRRRADRRCSPTTPAELVAAVRDARRAARAARGARPGGPRARARGFTWDSTAQGTLDGHGRRPMAAERPRLRDARFARSDSGKAAGLAAATLGNNAIQLVFTVVFTRLLGADRLRHAGRAHLGLPDPAGRRPVRAAGGGARGGARPPGPPRGPARDAARVDARSCSSRSSP